VASQAWSEVSHDSYTRRNLLEALAWALTVGDLGGNVVGNVGLADTVEDVSTDWAHESSVDGSKGTSGESPLLSGVVGYSISRTRVDPRK
jgi:hypothetical protein